MADEAATETAARFRLSMRRLASAVSVVACARDGEWLGMSATSVTSLSMDPPSLLVCINRQATMAANFAEGLRFSVNILDTRHEHVSVAFGSPALRATRFSDGGWCVSPTGVPVMREALSAIECIVDRLIEYGSHLIVIGRVDRVDLGDGVEPLIYCDGAYR